MRAQEENSHKLKRQPSIDTESIDLDLGLSVIEICKK
jgi:hypothetical protein